MRRSWVSVMVAERWDRVVRVKDELVLVVMERMGSGVGRRWSR
jgi:hypothetical protein